MFGKWAFEHSRAELKSHPNHQLFIQKIESRNWKKCIEVLRNDEVFAQIKDPAGFLPLHKVVKMGGDVELIQMLLISYPVSISIRDPEGYLPIHLAAQLHKLSLNLKLDETFLVLLKAYPEGILEKDPNGDTVVNIQIKSHAPDQLIKQAVALDERTLELCDFNENTPLHLAIQYDCSCDVILDMITRYPAACTRKNKAGCLPIHKAAFFNSDYSVFVSLLQQYPQGCFEVDCHGNLPIHLLYITRSSPPSEKLLSLMLKAYPASLGVTNKMGLLPMMMLYQYHDYFDSYSL